MLKTMLVASVSGGSSEPNSYSWVAASSTFFGVQDVLSVALLWTQSLPTWPQFLALCHSRHSSRKHSPLLL
eukprot:g32241.t1